MRYTYSFFTEYFQAKLNSTGKKKHKPPNLLQNHLPKVLIVQLNNK